MKRSALLVWLLLVLITMVGCNQQPSAGVSTAVSATLGPLNSVDDLVARLRAAGVTVTLGDPINQPFFSVPGRLIRLNSDQIQVFQFATAAAATEAAAMVSADGGTIGTTNITWAGTPHFYRNNNLIVIYVGDNQAIRTALQQAMGPQFAGR